MTIKVSVNCKVLVELRFLKVYEQKFVYKLCSVICGFPRWPPCNRFQLFMFIDYRKSPILAVAS